MIDDLWYKNAVFYCLNVGTFMDANGDDARGARPWHARDHRSRHQSHLRSTPWFRAARRQPRSRFRDFYCWEKQTLTNLLDEQHNAPDDHGRHSLALEPYGYRWFRHGPLLDTVRREPA
jgi:hypothetical protein